MAQLHVLLLVLANGHQVRLVEQDVRRHQAGIGKQAAIDVVRILGRLVLELGHAAELAEHGIALQHPAQFCVLVYMALDEQGVLLGVKAAGDVLGQLLQGAAAQICGVLPNGNGVQICHEVEAIVVVCPLGPVLHSAQVAAQGQVSGGLDAGEHSFLLLYYFTHNKRFLFQFFSFYHMNGRCARRFSE